MALRFHSLTLLLTTLVLSPHSTLSQPSPSPSPLPSTDDAPPSPSLSAALSFSPPAPPPSDLAPNSPSPVPKNTSPSPSLAAIGDVSHENQSDNLETDVDSSGGGMSGGQKAAIAIGVIAGVCVVCGGAFVYKKRQRNIRRAEFSYAARREFL